MEAIFFALVAYSGWGTGDIFSTIASRRIGSASTVFWSFALRFMLASLYIPFALSLLQGLTFQLFILNLILGIIFMIGIVSFNEALRIGNASLVGTISASFAALVVILSIVFLKDKIIFFQTISIIVIFVGLILSTLNFSEIHKMKIFNDKSIKLALLTMFCWGIYFTFIKIPINHIGWFWPNYITICLFPFIYLYVRVRQMKINSPVEKKAGVPLVLTTLLQSSADFSFNFSLSRGLTAVVAPIAGSYPTLFVFLAFLVFKDKITKQQILGIATTLTGIVLLSIFSV